MIPSGAGAEHAVRADTPSRWWPLVGTAALLGLAGGSAETFLLLARRLVLDRLLLLDPNTLWLAPVLAGVLAGCVALPAAAVLRSHRLGRSLSLGLGAAVAWAGPVLMLPGLHWATVLLLVLGLAALSSRLLGTRSERSSRTLAAGALLVALIATSAGAIEARLIPSWPWTSRSPDSQATGAARPNILLLILDTVRASELGLYGYPIATTPKLDRWASTGIVFDRAFATAPWTLPSHASVFTGRWAHELSTGYFHPLDRRFPTIAEFLRSEGYQTGGIVANVEYTGRETGLARGFDHYEDHRVGGASLLAGSMLLRRLKLGQLALAARGIDDVPGRKTARMVNRSILEWLRGRQAGQPFFLFANYYDAHAPYRPSSAYRRQFSAGPESAADWLALQPGGWDSVRVRSARASYDAALAELDDALGSLLDSLNAQGLLANTTVLITSDHGEEFAEHGVMGHGNSLYVAGVHVPLIIFGRNIPPAREHVRAPVSTRNLAATIADLAGGRAASGLGGHSLAAFWAGAGATPDEPVHSRVEYARRLPRHYPISGGALASVLVDRYRAIVPADGAPELYDLTADWGERHNLADSAGLQPIRDSLVRLAGSAGPSRHRP